MCFFDIISSTGYVLSTAPSPRETENVFGAIGNTETCVTQALFIQIGLSCSYFFGVLMLYYLLTIRFQMTDAVYSKNVEPFVNIFCIVWPLLTGIIGLLLKVYNNIGNVCFIGAYPRGCHHKGSEVECSRGKHYFSFMAIMVGVPLCFLFIFVPTSMAIVYWSVYKQRFTMEHKWGHVRRKYSLRYKGSSHKNPRRNKDLVSLSDDKQTKEVRLQALLYVGAFILTWIWPFIGQALKNKKSFSLVMCTQIFYPLQGFWNFFIYIRPRISNVRDAYPGQFFLTSLWIATYSKERYNMCNPRNRRKSTIFQNSRKSMKRKTDHGPVLITEDSKSQEKPVMPRLEEEEFGTSLETNNVTEDE